MNLVHSDVIPDNYAFWPKPDLDKRASIYHPMLRQSLRNYNYLLLKRTVSSKIIWDQDWPINLAQDSSDKVNATPDFGLFALNYDLHSASTMASSKQRSKCSEEIEMVWDGDEFENITKNASAKPGKLSMSKERKLSNEDVFMLPPKVSNNSMLRPAKLNIESTIPSSKGDETQQALKPMTILGFLKESCSDSFLKDPETEGLEKAATTHYSFISGSMSKVGAKIPTSTLG